MANIDWSTFWIIIAILWALPWKSWALWRAARNKQKTWFILRQKKNKKVHKKFNQIDHKQ